MTVSMLLRQLYARKRSVERMIRELEFLVRSSSKPPDELIRVIEALEAPAKPIRKPRKKAKAAAKS